MVGRKRSRRSLNNAWYPHTTVCQPGLVAEANPGWQCRELGYGRRRRSSVAGFAFLAMAISRGPLRLSDPNPFPAMRKPLVVVAWSLKPCSRWRIWCLWNSISALGKEGRSKQGFFFFFFFFSSLPPSLSIWDAECAGKLQGGGDNSVFTVNFFAFNWWSRCQIVFLLWGRRMA
jgi:hypothetical protein